MNGFYLYKKYNISTHFLKIIFSFLYLFQAPIPDQNPVIHQALSGNAIYVRDGGNRLEESRAERLVQSTPGSPQEINRPNSFEVIGSAESLVGRVSISITFLCIHWNENNH